MKTKFKLCGMENRFERQAFEQQQLPADLGSTKCAELWTWIKAKIMSPIKSKLELSIVEPVETPQKVADIIGWIFQKRSIHSFQDEWRWKVKQPTEFRVEPVEIAQVTTQNGKSDIPRVKMEIMFENTATEATVERRVFSRSARRSADWESAAAVR